MKFSRRARATSPGPSDRARRVAAPAHRVRIAGVATVLLSGVLAVPTMGWFGSSVTAQAQPSEGSCTRILEGTEWLFDPCIPEGEPLPQDVLDALEQIRRERECQPPSTTTPTSEPTSEPTVTSEPTGTVLPTDTVEPTYSDPTTPTYTETPYPTYPSYPTYPTYTYAAHAEADTQAEALPWPSSSTWTQTTEPSSPTWTETTAPTWTETTETTTDTTVPTEPTGPTESTTTTPSCPTTTEPTTTEPTSTEPTSTDPTSTEPTEPTTEPTEPPVDPPPTTCTDTTGEQEDRVREARGDRIDCRDPNTIPDRANPVVLVATGDSVTSAHHQWGFGTGVCDRTSADFRNLKGNNAIFSYVGRYYNNLNPNVVEYYNFARTGFGTTEMLGAAAGTADACANAWGRAFSPVALADATVRKAKADGRKAYWVTTGGVNNTNWTTVLAQLIKCRGMEFMQQTVIPRSSMAWNAIGGRGGIVTNGGGCTLRVRNINPFAMDYFHRIGVPRYDGPAQAAAITADVTRIVNTMLAAGTDKLVWMLYYDINPANIDLANFGWLFVRNNAPGWVVGLLPPRINANNQPLVDPMWVGAVRGLINNLNAAITAGIPANPKVRAQAAPIMLPGDIQNTAIGGSPHPSAAGHTKLSTTLDAAFRAL